MLQDYSLLLNSSYFAKNQNIYKVQDYWELSDMTQLTKITHLVTQNSITLIC